MLSFIILFIIIHTNSPLCVWESSKKALSSLFVCSISPTGEVENNNDILVLTNSTNWVCTVLFGTLIILHLCRAPLFSPVLLVFWPVHLQNKAHFADVHTYIIIKMITFTVLKSKIIINISPLHRIALLSPRASAVPELIFSTKRCLTFFSTETQNICWHTTAVNNNKHRMKI